MSAERSLDAEEIRQALEAARARVESERRREFVRFGIPDDCWWPCSRLFHRDSALGPAWQPALSAAQVEQHTLNLDYKRYPDAPRIALPRAADVRASLSSTIRERRSTAAFTTTPVALAELATLLELGVGVTRRQEIPRRAAPSGGALYPVETYVFAFAVNELATGLYHYVPVDGVLEQVRPLSDDSVAAAFLPPGLFAARPGVMVALSAVFARTQMKYLERGYRFALLEAGHMAQNLLLVATALGLNAVPVGGFWDDPFNEALGLDATREAVIYAVLFGHRASQTQ